MLIFNLAYHIVGYLGVNKLAHNRGLKHTLEIPWDASIPFVAYFAPFYGIVYFVPVIAFFIAWNNYELVKSAFKAFLFAGTVCLICFWVYPVEFSMRETLHPPYDVFTNIVRFFYYIDTPYNSFPSMHVALAFISVQIVDRQSPRLAPWFMALAIVITLSTFFVKQHFILDAIAGIALAYVSGWIFLPKKSAVRSAMAQELV